MRSSKPLFNKLFVVPAAAGVALGHLNADVPNGPQKPEQPDVPGRVEGAVPALTYEAFMARVAELNAEAEALVNFDFASPANQMLASQAMMQRGEQNRIQTYELARSQGYETSGVDKDGRKFSLYGFDSHGQPMYRTTTNFTSRITQGVDQISVGTELDLDGLGYMVGVWDGGRVLTEHIEFGDRVVQGDASPDLSDHATHVTGTICAAGELPLAIGMAPAVSVMSYDWDGDIGEMSGVAATHPYGGSVDIFVSNHSYGYLAGWFDMGEDENPRWLWIGDPAPGRYDQKWGQYDAGSVAADSLIFDSQYYLPVVSAGNEGNQPGPAAGQSWEDLAGGGGDNYRPGIDPERVFDRMGYDTVSSGINSAKNVLTVGATHDGVAGYDETFEQPGDARFLSNSGNPNGERDQEKVEITAFSSRGPVDDGRLKPEVVANGAGLLSSTAVGLAGYARYSGTSMSAPSVTGAIALLQQLAREEGNREGFRADEMKGLLCHTAYDLGNPGPDYIYGYGLVDAKAAADIVMSDRSTLVPGDSKIMQKGLVGLVSGSAEYRLSQYAIDAGGGEPLKITVTWIDPAGTAKNGANNRERALVNDLDIRLLTPSGEVVRPWTLDVENPEEDAVPGDNNVDPIEQIYIENPEGGLYQLLIVADRFDASASQFQQFSLIVTGAGSVTKTPVTEDAPADPVEWPFEIKPIDENAPEAISRIMHKVIHVYNIPIYGSVYASNKKMKIAADVLAEYIDNDEDGLADNGPIVSELSATGSMVLMFASEAEFNARSEAGDVDISFIASPNIKIMYADQVHKSLPKREVEESRSKMLSMMLRGGFSTYDLYEPAFEESRDSILFTLMSNAQGTTERKPTFEIPGWFHVRSTSARRLTSSYFYYVVGSRIGLFDAKGVGRRIEDEWELYNVDKLRGRDPFAYDLVNKPIYSMPTRLPDGDYDPKNPPAIPFF